MRKILIIGAGKSTSSLIKYFADNSQKENWEIEICDVSINHLEEQIKNYTNIKISNFDVFNDNQRQEKISNTDIVVSMLPARFHIVVAKDCLKYSKHLVTASYVSDDIAKLNDEVIQKGLIFMNEVGLDPGIDHLSSMKVIHDIIDSGAIMTGFESFTGGLVAPEYEKDNPWKYKFTWNPRNVVLAGQGPAAKFIQEGKYKYIPYHKIFRRTEYIDIEDYGKFQGYANRDSLRYQSLYGLQDVKTFYRGTLRRTGFCRAWDMFVQLGLTDDTYIMENSENMTYRDFLNSFLAYNISDSVELKMQHALNIDQDSDLMEKLEWLDLFKHIKIGLKNATPAQILQHILEKKWTLEPEDRDMVVMWHKFDYILDAKPRQIQSSMVVTGDNQMFTAMAKTVGLPLAITVKLILNGVINTPGVQIPLTKDVYLPILSELEEYGITFKEKTLEFFK